VFDIAERAGDDADAIVSVLRSASCVVAMVLWIALSACAFGGWGVLAAPLMLGPFVASVFQAVHRRSRRAKGGGKWEGNHLLLWGGIQGLLLAGTMAGVAAVFYSVDHAENDYEVATAGSNSERERVEQNYCARRTWLTDIGWGCSFLSTLLLFITLWLDPEHGMTAAARKHQSEDHLPTDQEILNSWLAAEPPLGHRGTM